MNQILQTVSIISNLIFNVLLWYELTAIVLWELSRKNLFVPSWPQLYFCFKKLEKTAFNKFVKANDVTGNKRYESFFNHLNNFYLLNDTMKAYRLRLLVGYFGYLCFPASGPGPRPEICIWWPRPSNCVCLFFVLQLKFVKSAPTCIYLLVKYNVGNKHIAIVWNFFTRDIFDILNFGYNCSHSVNFFFLIQLL